jgi:hypothetical protein
MKNLIFLAFPCFLVACSTSNSVVVDGISIKSGSRVGGKDMIFVKKGDTVVMAGANNEKSFSDLGGVVKWGIGAWAATDIWSTGNATYQSVKNSKTAADVTNTAAKEATKQASINATTEQAKIAAEVEAMEISSGL